MAAPHSLHLPSTHGLPHCAMKGSFDTHKLRNVPGEALTSPTKKGWPLGHSEM